MNRLSIVAIIAMVSCTQVTMIEPEVEQKSAIEFGTFIDKSSRAAETTTSNLAEAKVYAYKSDEVAWEESTSSTKYMDAVLTIDDVITCSPTSYWPGMVTGTEEYAKLSFFSYAPIDDKCVFAKVDNSPNITLDYSVDDEPATQSDLIFATEFNRTQADLTPEVSLEYNHLLSKISISALSSSTVTKVKSVKVRYSDDSAKRLASKGRYTHDVVNSTKSWSREESYHTGTTAELSPATDILLTPTPQQIVASESYMMLLPQSVSDGSLTAIIVYNNGVKDVEKECALTAPTGGEFEMGVHYNYTLDINSSNIVIKDIIINPWDAMEEIYPFNIYTAEQLASIGRDPLYVENGCYMIMNDIDVSNYIDERSGGVWRSLCADKAFTGEIVGQGFTISGIKIADTAGAKQGLFAQSVGANIHDLNISSPDITGGDRVGALVGLATNTTIKNCSVEGGEVNGTTRVGGLVGKAVGSTISYSHNNTLVSAKLSATQGMAGGITGICEGSTLLACYNRGVVAGVERIGGIAGSVTEGSKLVACYNTAAVTGYDTEDKKVVKDGTTRFFAGIAGYSKASEFVGCYNTGRITWARYADVASGIVGKDDGGNTLTACHHLIGSAKREVSTSKTLHSNADFRTITALNTLIPDMNTAISAMGYGGYSSFSSATYLPSVEPDVHITMGKFVEDSYEPIFDHYDIFKMSNLSGKYQVMNDIYAQSNVATVEPTTTVAIQPIGKSSEKPFTGAFNGYGFTLYELEMNKTWGACSSLFGYVKSSSTRAIENYKISKPNILNIDNGTVDYVAAFVGYLSGGYITNCHVIDGGKIECYDDTSAGIVAYCGNSTSEIKDCSNSATIKADSYVGGIVGRGSYFKTISGCSNSGVIIANASYAGGVLGAATPATGSKPGTIKNCSNHGSVTADTNYAGGIVGRYNGNNYLYSVDSGYEDGEYTFADIKGYIEGCYSSSTSAILVNDDYVGGIAGGASATDILGCYNNGSSKSTNSKGDATKCCAAGIVGDCDWTNIRCCYNSGTIIPTTQTTTNRAGGIAARGQHADVYSCYNSGKILNSTSDYTAAILGNYGIFLSTGDAHYCYFVAGTFPDGGGGTKVNDLAALNAKIGTMNSHDGSSYSFKQGGAGMLPYIVDGSGNMIGEQAPYVKY